MPRRQPPRQLHAMRSPACRAVSSKPNELRRESPSPYLVLLRLPPGRRPVETLVPVQPAATLRRNKASVSLRRPCHSVAAIPAAIVKLERAGITHSKSQSATRRLLHFWLEKCAQVSLELTTDCDERIPGQTGTDHECPRLVALLGEKGLSPLRKAGLVVVINATGMIAMNSAIVRIVTNDLRDRRGQTTNARGWWRCWARRVCPRCGKRGCL